jgi:hypothetical protein
MSKFARASWSRRSSKLQDAGVEADVWKIATGVRIARRVVAAARRNALEGHVGKRPPSEGTAAENQ